MQKQTKYDWQETNMSLFGSELEKLIKLASADGEPQWTGVGETMELLVWRIEQFRVVPWPKSKVGF
jgi:gelsolin